jgi:hypothetical protein
MLHFVYGLRARAARKRCGVREIRAWGHAPKLWPVEVGMGRRKSDRLLRAHAAAAIAQDLHEAASIVGT